MSEIENSDLAQPFDAQPLTEAEWGRDSVIPGGQPGGASQSRFHRAKLDVMNGSFGSALNVGKVQEYLDAVLGRNYAAVGASIPGASSPNGTSISLQAGPREITVTGKSFMDAVVLGNNKVMTVTAVKQERESSVVKSEIEFEVDHAGVVSACKRKEPEVPELEPGGICAAKRRKSERAKTSLVMKRISEEEVHSDATIEAKGGKGRIIIARSI